LENLKQTDEVARQLAQELTRLDALVCNAGLGVGVYNETRDGLDSHMQVNLFAQAHLTLTLLPVLQQTTDSRIVHQSSDLHRGATSSMKFETIEVIQPHKARSDLVPSRIVCANQSWPVWQGDRQRWSTVDQCYTSWRRQDRPTSSSRGGIWHFGQGWGGCCKALSQRPSRPRMPIGSLRCNVFRCCHRADSEFVYCA
jgi:NAD(P)-dependent dehydrogenase (short-subunit alcohol dehydrogenase family)